MRPVDDEQITHRRRPELAHLFIDGADDLVDRISPTPSDLELEQPLFGDDRRRVPELVGGVEVTDDPHVDVLAIRGE